MLLPDDHFNVEDLICNESFQQYCLGSTLKHQLLWKDWAAKFPHRAKEIAEAQSIVNMLNIRQGSRVAQLKMLKDGLDQSAAFKSAISSEDVSTAQNLTGATLKQNLADSILAQNRTGSTPKQKYESAASSLINKYAFNYRYLAGIAAVLVAVASLYLYVHPFSEDKTPVKRSDTYFSSGKALRKTVILKDGSVITLAKHSSIRLDEDFNTAKRELTLIGEAFFDVKHDVSHPFIVHTTFNDIRVLGTTFNIKAYPNSPAMETSLIRGSVSVGSKKYPGYFVVLKPNQKLITNNTDKKIPIALAAQDYQLSALKHPANTAPEEVQWVRKRLDLDNLPLFVIAQKLQDWYGIEVIVKGDDVKNYRYSGVFENETILKTLEALQLSYPFQFEIQGDQITIKK